MCTRKETKCFLKSLLTSYAHASRLSLEAGTLKELRNIAKSKASLVFLEPRAISKLWSLVISVNQAEQELHSLEIHPAVLHSSRESFSYRRKVSHSLTCYTNICKKLAHDFFWLSTSIGEDVVAGIRTPSPISKMKEVLPEAYDQFVKNINLLERHFGDMQDVEFTVENRRLWMLQCRSGKRTGQAAFKIAVDMVNEGLTTKEEALLKIDSDHVRQILHPTFSKEALNSAKYIDNVVAVGLAGGPGAAVGKLFPVLLDISLLVVKWLLTCAVNQKARSCFKHLKRKRCYTRNSFLSVRSLHRKMLEECGPRKAF